MKTDQQEQLFNDFFREYKDRIYRLCYGYLSDKKEIDDLFQEIMANIWKNLGSFRQESAIGTWVYRIAVNTALVFNRKLRRKHNLFQEWTTEKSGESRSENQEDQLEKGELLERMHGCIAGLPTNDRLIVTLLLEGLSYEEIAAVVGISVNYVGVKINRIKPVLARLMER
jgi:RNA polymerase sigma-70 factor, ECF subfamily